jgi:hypothetical protein
VKKIPEFNSRKKIDRVRWNIVEREERERERERERESS